MTINNDILTFEPADIAQLSAELQTALDAYAAPKPVEVLLSRIVNHVFLSAESQRTITRLDAVKTALLTATPESRAEAQAKIDEAGTILNVQFLPIDKP